MRVLSRDRYEVLDGAIDADSHEERYAGINHAYGLGDHDAPTTEASKPMALRGMTPLHPQRLVFPLIESTDRDQSCIDHVFVSTIQSCVPGLQAIDQSYLLISPVMRSGIGRPSAMDRLEFSD
jgi:hypothetical protein